jgi:hypothetical protein
MGAYQRTKGASGERELAGILAGNLGRVVKRNLGQARDGGDDITLERQGGGEICIEVKRRGAIACLAWMKQCATAAWTKGRRHVHGARNVPVVIMREDGGEWVAMMKLEHFCELVREDLAPVAPALVEAQSA